MKQVSLADKKKEMCTIAEASDNSSDYHLWDAKGRALDGRSNNLEVTQQ